MKYVICCVMLISIFGFSSKPKNITMGRANVVFEEIQTELTTGEWTLCSVKVINKATGTSSQLMYNQGPKLILTATILGFILNFHQNKSLLSGNY